MIIALISLGALLLGLAYLQLIRYLLRHWQRIPEWEIPSGWRPDLQVTVLVPARNEAHNIRRCLDSLSRQQYPIGLLEILVIDDHSEDRTAALVRAYQHPRLQLLQLSGAAGGKKAALTYGIRRASGELIITTDADCVLPAQWIASIASFYRAEDPVFIAAPVVLEARPQALERFQTLDMLGTMIVTGAGLQTDTIHLSNGANLAYPKGVFEAVGGFSGIDHLASGDDMLLMHKIAAAFPGRLRYLKSREAVAITPAVPGWRAFLQQRLRWATKSGSYRDRRILVVLALVFLLCWGILLSPLLVIFWGWPGLLPFLLLYSLKALADHRLLAAATGYFRQSALMAYFWPSQWLHTTYIAGIGLLANLVRRYRWKGRRVQ